MQAHYILQYMKQKKLQSTLRIGITGSPGAGKSTFIEAFGCFLIAKGLRVAVLAVDPSSTRSGGSILGDKTRMINLAASKDAFIRPSPSSGFLGGVTANTHEVITLCEYCGFDVILIETVGVGQSEIQIADLVDLCVLVVPPAAGDELQAIKKGIVEIADIIVVNKADGSLLEAARRTLSQYKHAIHLIHQTTANVWEPDVLKCSSLLNENIDDVWKSIESFKDFQVKTGNFVKKRSDQNKRMMWRQIHEEIVTRLERNETVKSKIENLLINVESGTFSPKFAAQVIVDDFLKGSK
jgi:LAO/AO transport system kinase